jgi:hypothetical protein
VPNRLEPINLVSFVGGLNLRRSQFQLADDESPDMCNVDVDPRGGFVTRRGWLRWNEEDVVDPFVIEWKPRNQFSHAKTTGEQDIYVVNGTKIYVAPVTGEFSEVPGVVAQANIHGCDFAAWGDTVYMTPGMFQPSVRRVGGVVSTLDGDNWSEVDAPLFGVLPQADFIEAHAGYLFVASTFENATSHYTRLRWSHPNRPDAWRQDDFIDLEAHGGRITGIMAFQDHLLIFKTNNIWALYGYDESTWQLVRVSTSTGCPCTTAATRSERHAFFFSASDKGGVYAYNGEAPVYISERLQPAFEQLFTYQNVYVSWAGRRLWVAVPWRMGTGPTQDVSSVFVFDPDVGDRGCWQMYRSDYGAIGPVIDASDINGKYPLGTFWSDRTACIVILDYLEEAYDAVYQQTVLATENGAVITTSDDLMIEMTGAANNTQQFESYYKTRWLHGGWPDRKKSWRRPTFVCREVPRETELVVEAFRDYDETTVKRSRTLRLAPQGGAMWTEEGYTLPGEDGFDWTLGGEDDSTGTGADYGPVQGGSRLIRGGSFGMARAIQMRISASPNSPRRRWGVDGIVAKIVMRRYR